MSVFLSNTCWCTANELQNVEVLYPFLLLLKIDTTKSLHGKYSFWRTVQADLRIFCKAKFSRRIAISELIHGHASAENLKPKNLHMSSSGSSNTAISGPIMKKGNFQGRNRPFKCALCRSAFRMRFHPKNHYSTVHENKKNFICYTCHCTFGLKWNMVSHIRRVHLGLRPHHCFVCNKNFDTKYDLTRHTCLVHKIQCK